MTTRVGLTAARGAGGWLKIVLGLSIASEGGFFFFFFCLCHAASQRTNNAQLFRGDLSRFLTTTTIFRSPTTTDFLLTLPYSVHHHLHHRHYTPHRAVRACPAPLMSISCVHFYVHLLCVHLLCVHLHYRGTSPTSREPTKLPKTEVQ